MASSAEAHPTEMRPSQIPLTLIVAATSKGGIGKNGALPWSLRSEMKYFARVTSRAAPQGAVSGGDGPLSSSSNSSTTIPNDSSSGVAPPRRNAVVMGRKTWESIPPRFRPLKGRINVVLSRSGEVQGLDGAGATGRGGDGDGADGDEVVLSKGLEEGLADLFAAAERDSSSGGRGAGLGRVFVIGGASVYEAALGLEQTRHVLLTRVEGDFDCDTFFPVDLEGEEGRRAGWRRESTDGLAAFTGEDFGSSPDGARQQEGDVRFEYRLYSR